VARHYRILFLVVAVCCVAVVSPATTIQRYSLAEVRDLAEVVFTGHVVSSAPLPVLNGKAIATRYTVEVDEVLYGKVGRSTTITFLEAGRNGAPSLDEGTRYLFFKTGQPNDTTVGWGQGLYRFEAIKTAAGAQTILVSADGEPLVMNDGALARGRSIMVLDGHVITATPDGVINDPRDTHRRPFAFDGTAPRPVVGARKSEVATPQTFATFDDLKRFVALGHPRNR
jgi:hypothetical protein